MPNELIIPIDNKKSMPKGLMIPYETFKKVMPKELIIPIGTLQKLCLKN